MTVVADTSPINYLVQLGHAELIPATYGRVIIPAIVLGELLASASRPSVRAWASSLPRWVTVQSAQNIPPRLTEALDLGEAHALSLALDLHADLVLMDDHDGRVMATSLGLNITGTLGVLVEGALRGVLDFERTLKELQQLGFWATDRTLDRARALLRSKSSRP